MLLKNRSSLAVFVAFYIMIGIILYVYQNPLRWNLRRYFTQLHIEELQELGEESASSLTPEKLSTVKKINALAFLQDKPQASQTAPLQPQVGLSLDMLPDQDSAQKLAQTINPSAEFKSFGFKTKVMDHLKSHIRVALKKASGFLQEQFCRSTQPQFFLEIDKIGNISNLALVSSSGSQIVDSFVLQTIQQATPFPPIPEHLNLKRFTLSD